MEEAPMKDRNVFARSRRPVLSAFIILLFASALGWGGAYYTAYWVDPAEQLVCVLMTQLLPATGSDLQGKFRTLVYQSIVDSYEKRPGF
jgi:hypothetical protein